ncbi:hypothetical protein G9A89_016378 [Geosiphon pyriformis]|nr:hypothetical protein G9A89_016378 [Geosiphon pyriformis]
MVLLQNNSEKPYTIESKEKIAQAIFLPLVKIGKFVPVENCEELSQTTREIFGFGSTGKGIEVNFTETIEEKGEVIKNEQSITLLPYGKSEIRIKRTIKEKDLIFEPYPETCQQNGKFGRTNLVQHQIPTGDTRPEKQCTYYVPSMEHNFIREEVQSMLEKEIIQLSMSP